MRTVIRHRSAASAAPPGFAPLVRVALLLALSIAPLGAWCQIYTGTSEQSGAIVLSNYATDEARVLLMAAPVAASGEVAPAMPAPRTGTASLRPLPAELHRIIDAAATRASVSPQLIRAVMEAESHFEPAAVSNRGAIGLMQLLPTTAKRFGALDPFDPAQNVTAGAAYLRWLMEYFGHDLELVLAGYNAGEQAVVRAGRKIPPYAETRAYVKRVMANLQRDATGLL